ncbi:MAG: hypothetical protein AAF642_14300 [Pseudomonadota bacterium]
MMIRATAAFLNALTLAACQHTTAPEPAILVEADADSLEALRAGLAQAMNRAQIEFGAGDPTATPSVAVLPPKPTALETQSTALPTMFDLYTRGETCFAIQRGAESEIVLPGVTCRAFK